jgi:ubiquinone/menaquinone biosynthesis C-methylase UbiE
MSFIDPASVVPYFELRPDMQAADFGCGAGAYVLAMSRAVLPNGKIFAIDVQKDILLALKNSAKEQHITNIEPLWGDIESAGGAKIGNGLLDFALCSNVLFQTEGGYKVALEMKRALKSGGRAAVIDWSDSFGHLGPHPEALVKKEDARRTFESVGFSFIREFPAGDHHYGLLFAKK